MLGLKIFSIGLLIVALVAALTSTPKVLEVGGEDIRWGFFNDESDIGHSILYSVLLSSGYNVRVVSIRELTSIDQNNIVILVVGPTTCNTGVVSSLAQAVHYFVTLGKNVRVVVASEGDCGIKIASTLLSGVTYFVQDYDNITVAYDPTTGIFYALYTFNTVKFSGDTGGRATGYAFVADKNNPMLRLEPVSYFFLSGGLELYYIADSHVFSNALLNASVEAGLGNLELALRVVSVSKPSNTTVLFVRDFYETKTKVVEVLGKVHPGIVLSNFIKGIVAFERDMLLVIKSYNALLISFIASVSALVYALLEYGVGFSVTSPRYKIEREKVFVLSASRELGKLLGQDKLEKADAKRALGVLYELLEQSLVRGYGIRVDDLLRDERLWGVVLGGKEGYSEESLGEVRRALMELKVLYEKKIKGSSLIPVVFFWERKLYSILSRLTPLLDSIAARIGEGKGIEYTAIY